MKTALPRLSLLLLTLSISMVNAAAADDALQVLKNKYPQIVWDVHHSSVGDVTCDGTDDSVILGSDTSNNVWIGVAPGTKRERQLPPVAMSFPIGSNTQASFCSRPETIEVYDRSCDQDGRALPGCHSDKKCKAFTVSDGDCDGFNFYWDDDNQRLTWWRN